MDRSKWRCFAERHMREKGATENRPEQQNLERLLRSFLPKDYLIHSEFLVTDLKPFGGLEPYLELPPRLDIVVLHLDSKKILLKFGFRVNGRSHERAVRKIRDKNQKILLEGNGWKIIDINWDDEPDAVLWDKKMDAARILKLKQKLSLFLTLKFLL